MSRIANIDHSQITENPKLDTHSKALKVNLDKRRYGTFAEIGAGQEVVRWFFRVGGAAGTIAKSMSAYDMAVSDAIYGPCDRYVSRSRLESMLDHEYRLNIDRLGPQRGESTSFLVLPTPFPPAIFKEPMIVMDGWASVFRSTQGIKIAKSSSMSECWITKISFNRKPLELWV